MSPDLSKYTWVVSDPAILWGAPHIKDTRLYVSQILECFAAGLTKEEIKEQYPSFPEESIEEIFRFAAESVKLQHVAN